MSEEWKVPTAALTSIHFAGYMDAQEEIKPKKQKMTVCKRCKEFVYDDEKLCMCGKENPIYVPTVEHKEPPYITSDELYNLNGFGSEEECNRQFV